MSEQIHTLNITGMTCGGCSGRVTRVLEATPGVLKADISHETDSGVVTTSADLSTSQIVEIVKSTGFEASA
ncbi:MAG: heavy-metal-associated domain-containing protein [Candidatus Poseidoniales archaeon]|jgi:copper chaperone CopZ|tara:strand:- start:19 stop:231 length:213 start_codon:yes stop_codon:yes gene_type:complete